MDSVMVFSGQRTQERRLYNWVLRYAQMTSTTKSQRRLGRSYPRFSRSIKISNPYPNVDLAGGSLLHAIGFRKPIITPPSSDGPEWQNHAQILDERNARGGRGVPI